MQSAAEPAPIETMDTPEGKARLLGLMAQLALPTVRGDDGVYRKPRIEIELRPKLNAQCIPACGVATTGADPWMHLTQCPMYWDPEFAWQVIDSVVIEPERVTFSFGVNGHRQEWVFMRRGEGIPKWRRVEGPRRNGL